MATFREFLERHRAVISATMYPGESFAGVIDDVVRVSRSQRGAGIVCCDPASIVEAVTLAASWPVRTGTDDGGALVVTDDTATPSGKPRLIAMLTARAKIWILSRHGGLRWVNARCVYAGEVYEPHQGTDPHVAKHEPLTMYPQKRGDLIGAYVQGLQRHGLPRVLEEMNKFDIDQIRKEWSRELRDGDLNELEYLAQYAMAKCIHRFCDRIQVSDAVRGWLSDLPPRRPDTDPSPVASSPVEDPVAVMQAAQVASVAPVESATTHPDDALDDEEPGDVVAAAAGFTPPF